MKELCSTVVDDLFRSLGHVPWFNPVVGETSDAFLNDIGGLHVRPEHAIQAIRSAGGWRRARRFPQPLPLEAAGRHSRHSWIQFHQTAREWLFSQGLVVEADDGGGDVQLVEVGAAESTGGDISEGQTQVP